MYDAEKDGKELGDREMKESTCNDGKESGGEDGGLHGGMWIRVMRR